MTYAFSHETLPIADTPTILTRLTYSPKDGVASKAFITCEGECRYTYHQDGAPSLYKGHLLRDGGYIVLHDIRQIEHFKAIRVGEGVCTLSISYERN